MKSGDLVIKQELKKIYPVNYLTVENVKRYRLLMNLFYTRHLQMQGVLYRPEILEIMRTEFSKEYNSVELDHDLEVLVDWGNLQKQQEIIRPKSIEEYRNKNFRYQISEEGILVEEMVFKLSNVKNAAQGELNEKGFRNLLTLLKRFVDGNGEDVQTWYEIRAEFQKIQKDTSNYIGYINSPEIDSRMKTEQFLIYKDKFINYLRDFIINVQSLYDDFTRIIRQLIKLDLTILIKAAHQKESEKLILDDISLVQVEENIKAEVNAIKKWFIESDTRKSEYDSLMYQTDQMISKITDLINFFGQELHQYQSRRKDYLHLAEWFAKASDLDEAKMMYAAIFGIEKVRHFYVSESSDAVTKNEDSWNLKPNVIYLENRGRGKRSEFKATVVKVDNKQKQLMLEKHIKQEQKRLTRINNYFIDGVINFEVIRNLDKESRSVFLQWISKAILSNREDKKFKRIVVKINTEFNYQVKIDIDLNSRIVVDCFDGLLEMPKVIIERIN